MRYFWLIFLFACTSSPNLSLENTMLGSINLARATPRTCGANNKVAVPALKWNAKLEIAADAHNRDMQSKNYFDHTSPSGSTPASRVEATGYSWKSIGENIALGQSTPEEVMTDWLQSAGHCNNIMSASYSEVAVAKLASNDKTYYWTMVLAKPK
jgi:uncharacterized protein YkwD